MESKVCSKCQEAKPLDAFAKNPTGTFGRRGDCKSCRKTYCNSWYANLDEESKKSRLSRPGRAEWMAAYYRRNKSYFQEVSRQWFENNRDKHRVSTRDAMRRRRATAKGKLESNVSRALYRALKRGKGGEPSFALLGFTVEQLMAHLERQFEKGMGWHNYGQWHVDHIIPLASFKYESACDPDFARAWALTNLRPLWAKANISKGAQRLLLI